MMCSEEDLKSIGLPLGPRKKMMGFLKEHEANLKVAKAAEVAPLPEQFLSSEQVKPADESVSTSKPKILLVDIILY